MARNHVATQARSQDGKFKYQGKPAVSAASSSSVASTVERITAERNDLVAWGDTLHATYDFAAHNAKKAQVAWNSAARDVATVTDPNEWGQIGDYHNKAQKGMRAANALIQDARVALEATRGDLDVFQERVDAVTDMIRNLEQTHLGHQEGLSVFSDTGEMLQRRLTDMRELEDTANARLQQVQPALLGTVNKYRAYFVENDLTPPNLPTNL